MSDEPETEPAEDLSLSPTSEQPPGAASAPPRVLLAHAALEAMREHGCTDTAHECGGVLVGEKLDGGRGPVVLVEAVIPGAHTDSRRGSVTFTHETWEQINREKDEKYGNLRIVGWYHTHPGFGIFLSDYDEFIQAHFFNLPWNVAFVLDPLSGEAGVFGWVEGQISRLPSYESYQVAEQPPAKTRVAPASAPAAEAAEAPALPPPPETPRAARWLRSPLRWGAVLLALFLLLALGLAGAWMLGTKLAIARHRAQMAPPPAMTAPPATGEIPAAPETPATGETPAAPETPAPPETPATGETPAVPPPTEAGPAPSASTRTQSAPARESPHESGEPAQSGS